MNENYKLKTLGDEGLREYYVTKARLTLPLVKADWTDKMCLIALRRRTKHVIKLLLMLQNMVSELSGGFYEVILAYMLSGKVQPEDYEKFGEAWCRFSHFRYVSEKSYKFHSRFIKSCQREFSDLTRLLNINETDNLCEPDDELKDV